VEVRAGQQTRLWHDYWLGDCPLKVRFHNLYQIAVNPDIEVAQAYDQRQWSISFRRQLNDSLREDWQDLQDMLSVVQWSEGTDVVCWTLERSGRYSTSSLYKAMTY
jgi:hypothetical protein